MNVSIRPATPGDADAVAGLLGELGYPSEVEPSRRRIVQLRRNAADQVLIAATREGILGLASLHVMPVFHRDDHLCRITAFVVAERHRGRGVGRQLAQAVVDFARKRDCFRVEVTSGRDRRGAHAFYRRVGFTQAGPRFFVDI
jgi:GNAT superfamily N-acetyltransferase